ncbi:HAD-IA family hydrolase [Cellulomonas oligotrophica]|uniref:FMN phosphatase YigB (HAD superfamily) n=1 Tax=Cellulomonas oligotrophica TaxID=931536 RepID=A0A7Y9JZE4_9CELL|nr:HAD-IA family hydrolase [Cellulomonas oligotrophica]NYD86704.1 FMN phosphatase YigB (HAD superfamily) [Cellulomonas oligotrophica]GIG34581.1 haloacid dehalogenase [Cellulomonas oligotrophica]
MTTTPTTRPTTAPAAPGSALDVAPHALLLDFGGVVFETSKVPGGRDDVTAELVALLARAGQHIDPVRVRTSLDAALTALKHWKHASSRRLAPREMDHREVVGDFVAADLPPAARAVLVAEADHVLDLLTSRLSTHRVRPGVPRLLDLAAAHGVRVGIVSNAHSGLSHRRLMAAHGLDRHVGVQVYSDEVGMRKPDPRTLALAAQALGVPLDACWYVGDTLDRDVVAGRRAGVGATLVTRSHHTDSPPFAVDAVPDAVVDTPDGIADLLERALATDAPAAPVAAPAGPSRGALLIDHGGVISTSVPDPVALDAFVDHLRRLLDAHADGLDVARLLADGRSRYAALKRERRGAALDGAPLREVDAVTFWVDVVGAALDDRRRAVLRAEAHDLTYRFGRAKSRRALRPGVRALLEHARERGMPVVVVSNTVSGRAVRAECAAHGLTELVGASVCSDENGHRKPDRRLVAEALAVADADPAASWFLGDKPENDAVAARACGVGRRVLVRGGSTPDVELDAALARGLATDVVDDPTGLLTLLRAHTPAVARLTLPA